MLVKPSNLLTASAVVIFPSEAATADFAKLNGLHMSLSFPHHFAVDARKHRDVPSKLLKRLF